MRAKPVDLPPPNAVRKPKHTITSDVVLYIFASCSLSSALGTLGRPGCSTSTIWVEEGEKDMLNRHNHTLFVDSSPFAFAGEDD